MSNNERIKRLHECMYDYAKKENFADIDENVAEVQRWNDKYQRCVVELRELTR